jgi:23S rRNA (cytidine1920-2'-O)/16S rRNA (cytidine1409-2'-O)-methyltransferase
MVKKRIDVLLVEKGLVDSRAQAQSLIMAGKVLVKDMPVTKAGALVSVDDPIRLKDISKYVSRGGLKLEKALADFQINVKDKICLDVGLSTGGFTDCLLQNGAKKIYGVDVGVGQLHRKIETDARVVSFDKTNFRHFDLNLILEPVDLVVMDVSFISATLLLPKIKELLSRDQIPHTLIVLVKPQFEVGRGNIGKGGIVKDQKARDSAVEKVKTCCVDLGFEDIRTIESPITGADGNVEYLLHAKF